MSAGAGMLHGIGGTLIGFGSKVISGVVGAVVGGVILVVGIVALSFFIPMLLQGQKAGVNTGVAINANANVAIGAAVESVKSGKTQRDYGASLERSASEKQLAKMRTANP